jgi:hypothetical protein
MTEGIFSPQPIIIFDDGVDLPQNIINTHRSLNSLCETHQIQSSLQDTTPCLLQDTTPLKKVLKLSNCLIAKIPVFNSF